MYRQNDTLNCSDYHNFIYWKYKELSKAFKILFTVTKGIKNWDESDSSGLKIKKKGKNALNSNYAYSNSNSIISGRETEYKKLHWMQVKKKMLEVIK